MRIAVAQTPGTRLEQWRETRALVSDVIREAAGLRAELVVLPECVWPAYCIGSRTAYDDARAAGLPSPADFLAEMRDLCRTLRLALCCGYIEEHAGRLFNTAALLASDGTLLGTHRKCFLWAFDHDYFTAGSCVVPVDSAFGGAGLMVCADARLPEIPAALAARGADFLLQPTAWVNAATPARPWNPQPDFLIRSRAAEFGVPCASASKWGLEGNTLFVGSSLICNADGDILVQCGQAETRVVAADVAPRRARPPVFSELEVQVLRATHTPTLAVPLGPLRLVPIPAGADESNIARDLLSDTANRAGTLGLRGEDAASPPGLFLGTADGRVTFVPLYAAVDLADMRVVGVRAADANRFAALRCHALSGVHAVVAFGSDAPLMHLQTRACENRVFIVQVGRTEWRVIDPDGRVTMERASTNMPAALSAIEIDVSAARDKCVARDTDVFAGRCAWLRHA